ncbi:MAG TPA: hypothetical protein VH186_05080 [Chloroflexia bacterium]|nr:hypothetical protein [Chloroflexia bacterium]
MKPIHKPGSRPLTMAAALSCLLVTLMLSTLTVSAAPNFASADFENVWNRTDKQVAAGQVSRTWLWGPAPFTAGLTEDYAEAPGGKRQVQYFDKSRMEINNPNGDRSNPYYVTNGLIVREMMDGRLQLGDNKFESRPAAEIGVAGDADDTQGPTYKALGKLTAKTVDQSGILVAGSVDRIGNTRFDVGDYGKKYQVSYAHYEPLTGHNIAGVFWSFLNQTDKVLNGQGQVVNGRLFDPVYYATGLPITEAYWAQVKVGGQVKDVLVQAFERRILTFTPSNTPAFQVEMGNVGQHYYNWRYVLNHNITVSNSVMGTAITAGQYIFWLDNRNGPNLTIYGYDTIKQSSFVVSQSPGGKFSLASDGKTLAWVQTPDQSIINGGSIQGYDLRSGKSFEIVAAKSQNMFGGLALDNSILFYQNGTSLFALNLTTGQEHVISSNGQRPVAGNGIVLWSEQQGSGGLASSEWSLHFALLDGSKPDTLIVKGKGPFSGYNISGSNVVWSFLPPAPDQAVYLYNTGNGNTTNLWSGMTGLTSGQAVSTSQPLIAGNKVAWVNGPGGGKPDWSVSVYDLSSKSGTILLTSTIPVQLWGITTSGRLVYSTGNSALLATYI